MLICIIFRTTSLCLTNIFFTHYSIDRTEIQYIFEHMFNIQGQIHIHGQSKLRLYSKLSQMAVLSKWWLTFTVPAPFNGRGFLLLEQYFSLPAIALTAQKFSISLNTCLIQRIKSMFMASQNCVYQLYSKLSQMAVL